MKDFEDEVSGYVNNAQIVATLSKLPLKDGVEHIFENLIQCYQALVDLTVIGKEEMPLVRAWVNDLLVWIDYSGSRNIVSATSALPSLPKCISP